MAKKKEVNTVEEKVPLSELETPLLPETDVSPPEDMGMKSWEDNCPDGEEGRADAGSTAKVLSEEVLDITPDEEDAGLPKEEAVFDVTEAEQPAVEAADSLPAEPLLPEPEAEDVPAADAAFLPEAAPAADEPPAEEPMPAKSRRTSRKKKAAGETEEAGPPSEPVAEESGNVLAGDIPLLVLPDILAEPAAPLEKPAAAPAPRRSGRTQPPSILTITSGDTVETEEDRLQTIWHEIRNAYRTRRILTGMFAGVEPQDNGKHLALVDYKGMRVVMPIREMMIQLGDPADASPHEQMRRQLKLLNNMLGAEIDFIVRGIDAKERKIVGSRREAMLKKRQTFYFETGPDGTYRVYECRIVQARVVAVAEKGIRVEIFGAECSIMARDLSWEWIGDAHERYAVGDAILVRIQSVQRPSLEELRIRADVKSITPNAGSEALRCCRVQGKYIGRVTGVRNGVVYIRLTNGVNAVAHSCYDYRTPGKMDDVSFVVTRIDEEHGVTLGLISRIIRQNL